MELSVIIPTTGDRDILDITLHHLKNAIAGRSIEIIVVDDSSDHSLHLLEGATLLHTGGRGASHARNAGIKKAKSELLLFLDDDILIERSHIEKTLKLHRQPTAKAFNFFWVYPDKLMEQLEKTKFGRYVLHEGLYSNAHRLNSLYTETSEIQKQGGLTSQYFSIEKRWMDTVKGYDPIPFAGVEDLLLYKKLKSRGVDVYLCPDQIIYQNEAKRIKVKKLFDRYRTGALTRRIAFLRGHEDLGVHFSRFERKKGKLGQKLLPFLTLMEKHLPYGYSYRKVIHYMLFTATFLGYYEDPLPPPYASEFDHKFRK
jgi:glycosyltransferase involved in cell wall biosynthesis